MRQNLALIILSKELLMCIMILMQWDYSLGYRHVYLLSTIICHDKKDIKSWHQWRWESYVGLEILSLVISSHDWIHCSQYRASGIECGLYACFGYGYCLLLHGLVYGNRVSLLHLIKLIYATNTIVSQHKSSCLKSEVSCLWVLRQRGC